MFLEKYWKTMQVHYFDTIIHVKIYLKSDDSVIQDR